MKHRNKVIKMLCLALALAMLFSVTAFAGSVSFSAGNGITATGSVGYSSATTTTSAPTYISAEIRFFYKNTNGIESMVLEEANNSGTSVTAYLSVPDDMAYHISSCGYHYAGSGFAIST